MPRFRPTRGLQRTTFAILLSLATTAASCWAFAAWGSLYGRPTITGRVAASSSDIVFHLTQATGISKVSWNAYASRLGAIQQLAPPLWSLPADPDAAALLYTSGQDVGGPQAAPGDVCEVATGWPLRAMVVRMRRQPIMPIGEKAMPGPLYTLLPANPDAAGSSAQWTPGIVLTPRAIPDRAVTLFEQRILPMRFYWFGFLINSMLALPAWSLVVRARSIRDGLRRWRGLCPDCGYSRVGTSPESRCPECGGR